MQQNLLTVNTNNDRIFPMNVSNGLLKIIIKELRKVVIKHLQIIGTMDYAVEYQTRLP